MDKKYHVTRKNNIMDDKEEAPNCTLLAHCLLPTFLFFVQGKKRIIVLFATLSSSYSYYFVSNNVFCSRWNGKMLKLISSLRSFFFFFVIR